jgi:hypothetical protein
VVRHQLDVSLQDDELLAEIQLATRLMIEASQRDRRLSRTEIDDVLGVGTAVPRPRTRRQEPPDPTTGAGQRLRR